MYDQEAVIRHYYSPSKFMVGSREEEGATAG